MNHIQEFTDRYAPIEVWPFCSIKICRDGKWYQMRPIEAPLKYCQTVIARLRRKDRQVHVTYLTGM